MKQAKYAILIVAILWGSSFAFQKEVLESMHPVLFTFLNFFITGLLFLIYSLITKKNLLYRLSEGVLLGVCVTAMELTQMWGLHISSAANTSFISNLGMLFIPYLGYIVYRHKVTLLDTVTLCIAGVGMYFLVGGINGVGYGDIFLFASAFFMSLYFLLSQRYEGESGVHMSVLCAQQFMTVSCITAVMMLVYPAFRTASYEGATYFVALILIFTALPYALIQWSSKYSNEMMVSMYDGVIEPLIGGVVAWVVFFEATSPLQVAGGLLMVAAFAISSLYTKRHALLHTS